MSAVTHQPPPLDIDDVRAAIHADGIAALPEAFAPEWAERLHEECMALHEAASAYESGRIGRGRNRWYFAVHPEQLSGIVDLLTHPYLTSISEALLGPDYEVAEVAFDVSFPGSKFQPWHRDFRGTSAGARTAARARWPSTCRPSTSSTRWGRSRWCGTHGDEIAVDNGMFPDPEAQARYEADPRRRKMKPRRGGMSVRTPLALHRGTPNRSERVRR